MANKMDSPFRCSFCGKSQDQVSKLISGGKDVYICDECVTLCAELVAEEQGFAGQDGPDGINLLKPMEIKAFLD